MNSVGLFANNNKSSLSDLSQKRIATKVLNIKQRANQIELANIKNIKDPKLQLKRVSQEMESIFVKMMYKQMKKNVHKGDLMNGGFAEEVFDDFLTDEYSKMTSQTQSMGIAKIIYDQYSKFVF